MSAMATTQTNGSVKKIRTGRRPTVQDAGIAAARLRSSRNGAIEATATPSMIPAVPIVPTSKSEDRLRIDALETELARSKAKLALLEDTIEYLRIHSSWPKEWVLAHGGAVEPGPDDSVDPAEQETVEIQDGDAASPATPSDAVAEEPTSEETPADPSASESTESTDPEPA